MRNHWFEIVLAAVLAAVYLGLSYWQSGSKLTQSEVDGYMKALERQLPKELQDRAEFLARLRAWAETDDGKPVDCTPVHHSAAVGSQRGQPVLDPSADRQAHRAPDWPPRRVSENGLAVEIADRQSHELSGKFRDAFHQRSCAGALRRAPAADRAQ